VFALDPHARDRVLSALRTLPLNTLFVQSVLCDHVDGRIYADDAREPRALYAVHPYGMALLWGEPGRKGWHAWLRDHLVATERAAEWLQVHPEPWSAVVESILADRFDGDDGALRCTRVNFAFDRDAYLRARATVAAALDRATIVPTDAAMFARIEGGVVPQRFWRDAAQFVAHGGGFSALADGEVAATAFCSFRHGAQLELGIETVPRRRGQGHARLAACRLIDDCLDRGLEPVWACRLENTSSFELARKLGFVPARHLPYYRLPSRPSAPAR